jgi:mRNA-degrading endonuclease toxin of MazEF toxin-antitoxin module
VAATPKELRYGRIVWTAVKDRHGFRKTRPCIVLTPTEQIRADEPIALMAVTTTFPEPPPPDHIPLPFHPDPRRVRTQLARRSAAVVTWVVTAYADEITDVIGDVPRTTMRAIQARLRERG